MGRPIFSLVTCTYFVILSVRPFSARVSAGVAISSSAPLRRMSCAVSREGHKGIKPQRSKVHTEWICCKTMPYSPAQPTRLNKHCSVELVTQYPLAISGCKLACEHCVSNYLTVCMRYHNPPVQACDTRRAYNLWSHALCVDYHYPDRHLTVG